VLLIIKTSAFVGTIIVYCISSKHKKYGKYSLEFQMKKIHYSKFEKYAQCKNSSAFSLSLPLDFQFVDDIFDFLKKSTKQAKWMSTDLQYKILLKLVH
jgi:geranylgeranyl pyrophosphate synthase